MKTAILLLATAFLGACSKSKPAAQQNPLHPEALESVADIPVPKDAPPPVQALAYDDGYKLGSIAGEALAKAEMATKPKNKPATPDEKEIAVMALDAAGTDPKRGEKWQRGFSAGFKDSFTNLVEGKL